ncbi:MAG: hypothetical protein PUA98_03885 [Selenomonadaceae bacterium]|nr:hypothetical protein [Selenomonadaceae bacterium]
MLIEGIDYLIRLTSGLGPKVKGFVCEDADGHYNIYVNKDHTCEQQMQTIRHELEHIENADMESATPPTSWRPNGISLGHDINMVKISNCV